MAIANLTWDVDAVTLAALVVAGYDEWVVERSATVPPPPPVVWSEISHTTTRPPLAEAVLRYVYTDAAATVAALTGLPDASYRATPRKSSDGSLGASVVATARRRGYITAQDIWDEGYANPPWTAAKVWRGIDRATATIDSLCRQWFEPRYAQFAIDGNGLDKMWLDIPVCAIHRVGQDDVEVDLTDLTVYNRHLTRGQLNPDDRNNPMVGYSLDFPVGYRGRLSRIYADAAIFGSGRMNVVLKGVFGFTELGAGDFAAETEDGSQIPLSYGTTPPEIARAALLLSLTYMLPAGEQQEVVLANRVTRVQTRDQSIHFSDMASGSSSDASFGLTGNLEVDNILMRYAGPLRMGAAG